MYFYEVLNSCDEKELIEEFMKLCIDSPNIEKIRSKLINALNYLKRIIPVLSDNDILHVEKQIGSFMDEHEEYFNVYLEQDHTTYSIIDCSWKEVLGFTVCKNEIDKFGKIIFTANVLWEMTFLGFDEKTIAKKLKELDEM